MFIRVFDFIVLVVVLASAGRVGGSAPESAEEPNLQWKAAFDKLYRLDPGQALKRVPPPFIPERFTVYQRLVPGGGKGPDSIVFHGRPRAQVQQWGDWSGVNGRMPLRQVLSFVLQMGPHEFEGTDELLSLELPGDWVINPDASTPQKLGGLTGVVREAHGRLVRFERRDVERDVIVARGRFRITPLPEVRDPRVVFLYTGFRDPARGGQRTGELSEFFRTVGLCAGRAVVDETEGPKPQDFDWVPQGSAYIVYQKPGPLRVQSLRKLLDVVSAQTSLKLEIGRRKVPVWTVVEGPAAG